MNIVHEVPPSIKAESNRIRLAFLELLDLHIDEKTNASSAQYQAAYTRLRNLLRLDPKSYLKLFQVEQDLWVVRYAPQFGHVFYNRVTIE